MATALLLRHWATLNNCDNNYFHLNNMIQIGITLAVTAWTWIQFSINENPRWLAAVWPCTHAASGRINIVTFYVMQSADLLDFFYYWEKWHIVTVLYSFCKIIHSWRGYFVVGLVFHHLLRGCLASQAPAVALSKWLTAVLKISSQLVLIHISSY